MRTVALGLCLLVGAASANPPTRLSAAQLEAEIHAVGAKTVLIKYYDTPAWSASIMPGISSASPAWLRVAERLKAGSDAASSEDLGIALYDALAVAPFRVLPVLTRVYGGSLEDICDVSFEAQVPKQGVSAYLQSVREKLASARTEREKTVAAECLRGLELSQAAATEQGLK